MPAAPRTDPYVKNSLIRLLPLVERETGLSDTDEGPSVAVGNERQDVPFVTMAKQHGLVDCDVAVDVARAW